MFRSLTYVLQVVSVFFIVGVIFVPIGVVSLIAARDVCCLFVLWLPS